MKFNRFVIPIVNIIIALMFVIWIVFYYNSSHFKLGLFILIGIYTVFLVVLYVRFLLREKIISKKNNELEEKNDEIIKINNQLKNVRASKNKLQERLLNISQSYSEKVIENLKEINNRNLFIESILNSVRVNIYVLDNKGIIVSINKELENILGINKEKLIGKKYDYLSDIEEKYLKSVFEEGRYENISNSEEVIFIKAQELDILKSISMNFGEENEFLGVVISFVEITKIKTLERSLKAINKQNQDIFNNIKSGIISIGRNFIIKSQYSMQMTKLFPNRNISGRTINEFLLENNKNPTTKDYLESIIDIVLNRARTPVSTVNSMPVMTEFPIFLRNKESAYFEKKYYKLNFERIFDNEELTGAMLIINDITEQKILRDNLKKETETHQKEIELIYKLLKVNPQICKETIDESYTRIENIKIAINSKNWDKINQIEKEYLNTLTRYSHSIKGLTRMISMMDSSQRAHELENIFIRQRDNENLSIKVFITQVKEKLENLQKDFNKETNFANKILGLDKENTNLNDNVVSIETQKLENLITNYNNLSLHLAGSKTIPKSLFLKLLDSIYQINKSSIIPFADSLNEMIQNLSEQLEKKMKHLKIIGNTTEIDHKVLTTLRDPIIHIIRNAIDHGIEIPEIRKQKQKNEKGEITLNINEDETFLTIAISDDGSGIDINKLRKKAVELGIKYVEENKLVNLLFIDGISTKKDSSNISGRGVGMSLVKEAVRSLGGKLYVKSVKNKGMTISIRIPLSVIAGQNQE